MRDSTTAPENLVDGAAHDADRLAAQKGAPPPPPPPPRPPPRTVEARARGENGLGTGASSVASPSGGLASLKTPPTRRSPRTPRQRRRRAGAGPRGGARGGGGLAASPRHGHGRRHRPNPTSGAAHRSRPARLRQSNRRTGEWRHDDEGRTRMRTIVAAVQTLEALCFGTGFSCAKACASEH